MFGVPGLTQSIITLDIIDLLASSSFVACIIIYILFVKDTFKGL